MSPEQPPIAWDALREWARLFADYHRSPKLQKPRSKLPLKSL